LCDKLTSPGLGYLPPPVRAEADILWCGERNGLVVTSEFLLLSSPDILYILVILYSPQMKDQVV